MPRLLLLSVLFLTQLLSAQTPSRYLARSVSDTDFTYVRKQAKEVMSIEFSIDISASSDDFYPQLSTAKPEEPASLEYIKKLEKKLKDKPEDAAVYNEMGLTYKRLKMAAPALENFLKAEKRMKQLLADHPGDKTHLETAIAIYINLENYSEARIYMEELLYRDPDSELAAAMLPMCYLALNMYEHGNLFIDSSLARHPGSLTVRVMKLVWSVGRQMQSFDTITVSQPYFNKRPEEMMDLGWQKKAMDAHPDDFRFKLFYEYSRTMLLTLKMLRTIDVEKRLCRPDSVDRIVTAELKQFFNDALQKKDFKNKYILHKSLGVLLVLENQPAAAQAQFEKALTYLPKAQSTRMHNTAETYDNLSGSCMLAWDTACAERWVQEKIKAKPGIDPRAEDYIKLSEYRLQRGDVAKVRELCATAITLDPQSDRPHLFLAAASILENKPENAQQELDLALTKNKDNPQAMLLLGISQFLQKNFDYAYVAFESVMRNDPGNEVARELFRRYYIKKQQ